MRFFLIILVSCMHLPFLNAQVVLTKPWLMSFHVCGTGCNGFQDHQVHLAESDDLIHWSLVPGFQPYSGSVPDVITRGDELYLYTPGRVRRFRQNQGFLDALPVTVTVRDGSGNPVSFVDPSAIVDENGKLVLFFLNSTGFMGDPAGCNPYPCTKYFDSATEVDGSDGTEFLLDSGHRYEINLTSGTASDPDIFAQGSSFYLYISRGNATAVYHSSSLRNTYSTVGLPNDQLTSAGGIPSGIWNQGQNRFHTFVHSNMGGSVVIRSGYHSDFSQSLNTLQVVVSDTLSGLQAQDKTESPGVCWNSMVASARPDEFYSGADPSVATLTGNAGEIICWEILDFAGEEVKLWNATGQLVWQEMNGIIPAGNLPRGVYVAQWRGVRKMLKK